MNKTLLDIIALGGAMVGSLLLAANIGLNFVGYIFFLASSLASLYLLLKSNVSKSVVAMTAWFVLMNVVGLVRY